MSQLINSGSMTNTDGKKKETATLPGVVDLEALSVATWTRHATKRAPKNEHVNKVPAIKRKGEDPKFSSQQQGLSEGNENKKHKRGKHFQKGQEKQNK